MAYEQWYPDETKEEWMAVGCAIILTGFLCLGGYGVYKLITKNNNTEPKTEQVAKKSPTPKDIIVYKDIKTK